MFGSLRPPTTPARPVHPSAMLGAPASPRAAGGGLRAGPFARAPHTRVWASARLLPTRRAAPQSSSTCRPRRFPRTSRPSTLRPPPAPPLAALSFLCHSICHQSRLSTTYPSVLEHLKTPPPPAGVTVAAAGAHVAVPRLPRRHCRPQPWRPTYHPRRRRRVWRQNPPRPRRRLPRPRPPPRLRRLCLLQLQRRPPLRWRRPLWRHPPRRRHRPWRHPLLLRHPSRQHPRRLRPPRLFLPRQHRHPPTGLPRWPRRRSPQ